MSISVELFRGAAAEWDDALRALKGWTHFHLHGWMDVLARTHRLETIPLVARGADGTIEALLPLVRIKSALFGHYLVSMPFVNYGGPLGSELGVRALAAYAVELADDRSIKLLELRSRGPLPLEMAVSHRKITVVLDVPPGGPDAMFATFRAKLRSQIRRPQKEGVTMAFGADQVAPFYEVFARHMRDLGTPAQPRRLFQNLAARFGPDAWFGCAWHGGRAVACGAGFRWGDEFEMTWASALAEYNPLSPNMLLYWAFMERAATEGVKLFNFGRCTPGGGTHRFKLQWGSRDEQLHWYQHSPGGRAAATPSPDAGAYSLGPRLWKRLPLAAANILGPRIVRGIP